MGVGKVKGQLSLRPVGTLVVRERMGKALAVQSGQALSMGRCASPPCLHVYSSWLGPLQVFSTYTCKEVMWILNC